MENPLAQNVQGDFFVINAKVVLSRLFGIDTKDVQSRMFSWICNIDARDVQPGMFSRICNIDARDVQPGMFSRICNPTGNNISICNAIKAV